MTMPTLRSSSPDGRGNPAGKDYNPSDPLVMDERTFILNPVKTLSIFLGISRWQARKRLIKDHRLKHAVVTRAVTDDGMIVYERGSK